MTQLLRNFHPLMNGWCPLFARKFAPNARAKLRELARFYVSRVASADAQAVNGTQRRLMDGSETWMHDSELAAVVLDLQEVWHTGSLEH